VLGMNDIDRSVVDQRETYDDRDGGSAPAAPSTDWYLDAASYATTWEYSDSGKIVEIENLTSGGSAVTDEFAYPETGPVHAVTSVYDGTTTNTFNYDDAGRMDSRTVDGDTTILTWDVLSNLVKTVETGGDTFLYVYDGSGQRVVKINVTQDAATAYLGSTEVTDLDTTTNHTTDIELESTSFVTGSRFYTFGGATVAVREATPAASTFSLLLGDMQGSAQVMMKVDPDAQSSTGLEVASSTTVNLETDVTRSAYMPYGAVRGDDNLSIDHGWLNQVTDETDTGLVYLNARYYDPVLSRFVSPDPLMKPSDPSTLDPYLYAGNNPVTYSDASGLCYTGPGARGYVGSVLEDRCNEKDNGSRYKKTPAPGSESSGTQTYTYVGDSENAPKGEKYLTDPGDWCLVGQLVGFSANCGTPPDDGDIEDPSKFEAILDFFADRGTDASNGVSAIGGFEKATVIEVRGYWRGSTWVQSYKRYLPGQYGIKGLLAEPNGGALSKSVKVANGVAFVFVGVEAGIEAWDRSSDYGWEIQLTYSVASGLAEGGAVVAGTTSGAYLGLSCGPLAWICSPVLAAGGGLAAWWLVDTATDKAWEWSLEPAS